MSELVTAEIFTDGQESINASNMNGIIGLATVQPDIIAAKPVSAAMDIADQFLVLKTDNTLARGRFDTITNSVASQLPIADSTKNGMLKQTSGKTTDFLDGTNSYQPISNILPPGMVVDFAGGFTPVGWLLCDGSSKTTAAYPGLFAAIGYGYGGSGANFNVPNFTGRVSAGAGGGFGGITTTGGATSTALSLSNMPNHTHGITDVQHNHSDSGHAHTYNTLTGAGGTIQGGSGWAFGSAVTAPSGAGVLPSYSGINTTLGVPGAVGAAFSIAPPFLTVNKIIKT